MASTYLTRTLGTPTNNKKWTLSAWIKKGHIGGDINTLFSAGGDSSNYQQIWSNYSSGQLQYYSQVSGGSALGSFRLSNRLRDVSGWYNLVISFDSANVTDSERLKIYINGNQELDTSVGGDLTYPTQNQASLINSAIEHTIGKDSYRNASYLDSSVSHLHFIDGTAYDASYFGETDATTGEWKIKTSPSVTYGTNGFFILKDGNSVTDQSPNTNNFTVGGGTLTKTEDSPDNVFATMNPLDNFWAGGTFTNGNNTIATGSSTASYSTGTLGVNTGKFYWEVKVSSLPSDVSLIGIASELTTSNSKTLGTNATDYAVYSYNGNKINGGNSSSYGNSFTLNDIISVALDVTNSKLYFRKNNDAWMNSGNPESGSTGTGAISIASSSTTPTGFYFPSVGDWSMSNSLGFQINFGNGYFGTTAVSSAGTNASGNGIFEFDCPTGFTALSTKGLNL